MFGLGGVGLAALLGARLAGAKLIVAVDRIESKLLLALELGASVVVPADGHDPAEGVRSSRAAGPTR